MVDKPPFRKPTDYEHLVAAKEARQQLYERLPPKGERGAALDKLHSQLVDDARLYESAALQDQRDAVAHALCAVVDFLRAEGFTSTTLVPLMRPVEALVERENNSLDMMFAQRARAGRPKATLADHERTGILAALAEGWLRTHESEDTTQSVKLADAARKMKGRWFGTVTRAQLETARELVSQESKDHPAVYTARWFSAFFVEAAKRFGADNAFPIMVGILNTQLAAVGGGEGGISKTPGVSQTD